MSDGRTIWMPKDTGWWRREHVVELGEEFGPVGPAVLDWLSCEAKLQNDGGRVKAGPRTLARGVFSDLVTVRNVLSHAVTIGALHDFEEHDGRFTCTISGWESDNRKGWNAFRQADYRAKNRGEVTERNGLSRPVAPREEESREEKTPPTPQGGEAQVEARREEAAVFLHWQRECDHTKALFSRDRRQKIRARLREGYTVDQLKQAIDGAAVGAYVDENGKRHDDITLICRNASKLEDFIGRATRKKEKPSGQRAGLTVLSGSAKCRWCPTEINSLQRNNQSGLCDPCYQEHEARLTGDAA